MEWNDILVSAFVFAIVSVVIHTVGAIATMDYYTNPAYFPLWSSLMMPNAGPPGMEFYAVSLSFAFIIGILFAYAYSVMQKGIPGKGAMKGFNYGILLFMLAGLPTTLMLYELLAIPLGLILSWTLESLAIYLIGGAVFSKFVR